MKVTLLSNKKNAMFTEKKSVHPIMTMISMYSINNFYQKRKIFK